MLIVEHVSCKVNSQIEVGDFKYMGNICPLHIGDVVRRMRSG